MRLGPFTNPLMAGLGVAGLLIGGTWIGQGLNLIPGSFMTGDPTWFVIGSIVFLGGVLLLLLGLGRFGRDPNGPPGQH
ncbi:MAG: hypothetical protein AVDCRST_MAG75-2791 [uncultured Propionibacteriaceae bacterium]|uniref:Integral membrane protein n=1 Tax=uncultured Propionibacteriaceae bacterium TaxID=257457 RepID=A0A6J4PFS2_9ACTN|nr:MAG: hypothetical protein AVDCRST_MAG75-2791 [uncultured Propionibacteriaceae bacterium]